MGDDSDMIDEKPDEAQAFDRVAHVLERHEAELRALRKEFDDFRRRVAAVGDMLSSVDPDRARTT